MKLALSYEKTGQLERAANEYENISSLSIATNARLAQEALWTAAEMYDKAKRTDESVRVYKSYITRFPKPLDAHMAAAFRIYTFYDKQNNVFESQYWLREIARNHDSAGTENTSRMHELGTMAKIKLNFPLYDTAANERTSVSLANLEAAQKAYDNKDYETSFNLYKQEAEKGKYYAAGQGALNSFSDAYRQKKSDYKSLADWYRNRAELNLYVEQAEKGDTEAQYKAGYIHYNQGVFHSYELAAAWYQKAAEQGNTNAQYNLGLMYISGQGVPQDNQKAKYWLQKAADQANKEAINVLEKLNAMGK